MSYEYFYKHLVETDVEENYTSYFFYLLCEQNFFRSHARSVKFFRDLIYNQVPPGPKRREHNSSKHDKGSSLLP